MLLQALIDMTDNEHSRKVSDISGILAKYAGYSFEDTQTLQQAALLHDIGKFDIPQEIINKPGALTSKEFSIVKRHTQLGCERIKTALQILTDSCVIAEYHHERLNGTGYRGLTSEAIHPHARLISIADVCDALISKRPYKNGWAMNEVIRYFEDQSGILFDAGLISVFLEHTDEIAGLYR